MNNDYNFEHGRYKDDCDMIDICEEIGATYGLCYKGALLTRRCDPAKKQALLLGYQQNKLQLEIQDREDARLKREEEVQTLRDKKAVRRSWFQLLIAALLGGLFTKLIDLLPQIIDWITKP